MSKHEHHRTSVSALMGITIVNSDGGAVGRVAELAVAPAMDTAHVYGLILKHARGAAAEMVHVSQLEVTDAGTLQLRQGRTASALLDAESYLMLERDVLDQQIIDIHGHKVVRVNDVDLVWGRVPRSRPAWARPGQAAQSTQRQQTRTGSPEPC